MYSQLLATNASYVLARASPAAQGRGAMAQTHIVHRESDSRPQSATESNGAPEETAPYRVPATHSVNHAKQQSLSIDSTYKNKDLRFG
eukprot:6185554-Pleurochrysis_carterae.AAC.1